MNNFSKYWKNHNSNHGLSKKLCTSESNLHQNVSSTDLAEERSETHDKSSSGPRTVKRKLLPISSSVCSSFGASNDMETQDSASSFSLCHNGEEEPRNKAGFKRKRNAELNKLYEKKRSNKMHKKMFALKAIVPNCNKEDTVSLLDNTINYIRALQLQLKIMSNMGSVLIMPPPNPMSHVMLNYGATNLSHFYMNYGVCGGVQISPLQMSSMYRPSTLEMLGFIPLSVSPASFVPLHFQL